MSIRELINQIVAQDPEAPAEEVAEEIADALWLLYQMRQHSTADASPPPAQAIAPEPPPPTPPIPFVPPTSPTSHPDVTPPTYDTPGDPQDIEPTTVYPDTGNSKDAKEQGSNIASIRLPAAAALPHKLALGRELRPLRRQVPSRTAFVLDANATVQRSAEYHAISPVLRPSLRRWLAVDLVVDLSASMVVWRSTIQEFQKLLVQQGAFWDVRVWSLDTEAASDRLPLYSGIAFERQQSPRNPNELRDPQGQRLILLVTDAISVGWETGQVAQVLAAWAMTNPIAIVQVLPPEHWSRTALGQELEAVLFAHEAGSPSGRMSGYMIDEWGTALPLSTDRVRVPVLTLTPQLVRDWVETLAGKRETHVRAFAFTIDNRLPLPRATIGLSAEERVERFQEIASAQAYNFALALAYCPLITPLTMNIVRDVVRPPADQTHVAEVLLGGLLRQVTPPDQIVNSDLIQYVFHEGVQDILRRQSPLDQAYDIYQAVSTYFEQHFDNLKTMAGSLVLPGVEHAEDLRSSGTFAEIRTALLRALGYSELAELIERQMQIRTKKNPKLPPSSTLLAVSEKSIDCLELWQVASIKTNPCAPTHLLNTGSFEQSCALSFDGTKLVTGAEDGTIHMWDVETGAKIRTFEGHTNQVTECVLTRDDRTLITAGLFDGLRIWDVRDAKLRYSFPWPTPHCSVSPDGRMIAAATDDQETIVVDAITGQILRRLPGGVCCAFSRDGLLLATAIGSQLLLYEVSTGIEMSRLQGHTRAVYHCDFGPNDQLASAAEDGTIRIWDTKTAVTTQVIEGQTTPDFFWRCRFTLDGHSILTVSMNGRVQLWNIADGTEQQRLYSDTRQIPYNCSIAGNGNRVVTICREARAHIWELPPIISYPRPIRQTKPWVCNFSPNGKYFVTAGGNFELELWDTETYTIITVLSGHSDVILQGSFSPEGSLFASGSADSTIRVWDMASKSLRSIIKGHVGRIICCCFTPEGQILSGGDDGVLRLCNIDGTCVATIPAHIKSIQSCRVSTDGRWFVSTSVDKHMKIWDAHTYQLVFDSGDQKDNILDCDISADCLRVLSASNKTITIWDLSTNKVITTLKGHQGYIWSGKFSPDNRYIASIDEQSHLLIWDNVSASSVLEYTFHEALFACDWRADSAMLAVTSENNVFFLSILPQNGVSA